MTSGEGTSLVVGVGGSGKTHFLDAYASAATGVDIKQLSGDSALSGSSLIARATGLSQDADAVTLADGMANELGPDDLLLVDDLHLVDDLSLAALRLYVLNGRNLVATTRPGKHRPSLAELIELLTRDHPARQLDGFDHDQLGVAATAWSGQSAPEELVTALLELSGGNPGLAHDLVIGGFAGADEQLPDAAVDRVMTRLGLLDPESAEVAQVLALSTSLPDDAMAALADVNVQRLSHAIEALRSAGLAEPDADRLVPLVARSVIASWSPTELRRRHRSIAETLIKLEIDDTRIALHLRDAEVTGEVAAAAFVAAGDDVRWHQASEAIEWYDLALVAGAPPSAVAISRAEASLATGATGVRGLVDQFDRDDPVQRSRARIILAALDAADARPDRAAARLLDAADHPAVRAAALHNVAIPFLVSLGRLEEAREVSGEAELDDLDATEHLVELVAVASVDAAAGADPIPMLIEAVELLEAAPPSLPPVLTPHSILAAHAELVGDFALAESVLSRAVAKEVGGATMVRHHELCQGWIRFRQGRNDTGARLLNDLDHSTLPPRDSLYLAALDAGLARRSGDIARLRDSWTGAEPALLRQTADLSVFGPITELILAAARLGEHARAEAVENQLESIIEAAGVAPTAWLLALAWHKTQVAVVLEDGEAADQAASLVEEALKGGTGPTGAFHSAIGAAARSWAQLLEGSVDPDLVTSSVDLLHLAQMPWDAARLAGQAAVRTTDAGAARSLLERARLLKTPLPDPDAPRAADSPLSDREREVAALVVDGLTYKAVGAQLYISAKTVEHHVAHIRRKLGAESRAEMLAALREIV